MAYSQKLRDALGIGAPPPDTSINTLAAGVRLSERLQVADAPMVYLLELLTEISGQQSLGEVRDVEAGGRCCAHRLAIQLGHIHNNIHKLAARLKANGGRGK